MQITIISGSHRKASQSEKIGRYICDRFEQDYPQVSAELFSLAENPLPLWDESIWEGSEQWQQRLQPIRQQLVNSDAFIVIAPEWHGQVPAGLKNFFLLFSRFELGHKPAYIIGVSSSTGGAYPVAELRMSSYKNNRLCYIPEHLIVRDVENVLNTPPGDNDDEADSYFKARLKWGLDLLLGYAEALKSMREKTAIHDERFGNGM